VNRATWPLLQQAAKARLNLCASHTNGANVIWAADGPQGALIYGTGVSHGAIVPVRREWRASAPCHEVTLM
jgi:hypothetical protein